jgi:Ca2+-binding RTX toxin-like protein
LHYGEEETVEIATAEMPDPVTVLQAVESSVHLDNLSAETDDVLQGDGSEHLHFIISGIPSGVLLTSSEGGDINDLVGVYIGDDQSGNSQWLLTAEQIENGIYVTNFSGNEYAGDNQIALKLTGIIVEDDANLADFNDQGIALGSEDFTVSLAANAGGEGGEGGDNCALSPPAQFSIVFVNDPRYEDDDVMPFTLTDDHSGEALASLGAGSVPPGLSVTLTLTSGSAVILIDSDGNLVPSGDVISVDPINGQYVINPVAFAEFIADHSGGSLAIQPGEDQAHATDPSSPYDLSLTYTSHQLSGEDCSLHSSSPVSATIPIIPVTDTPIINVQNSGGLEDSSGIKLSINVIAKDQDGSENVSGDILDASDPAIPPITAFVNLNEGILYGNNPGSVIDDGGGNYTIFDTSDVYFQPTLHYHGEIAINVTGWAQDLPDGLVSGISETTIHVEAVADAPLINGSTTPVAKTVTVDEDQSDPINVNQAWLMQQIDTDGSELIGIELRSIEDIFNTAIILDRGSYDAASNSYTLTPAEYNGLEISTVADYSGSVPISIKVTTVEKSNGDFAETVAEGTITILPTPDIVLTVPDSLIVDESRDGLVLSTNTIALGMAAIVTDLDGSEFLTSARVTFTNLPDGATITGGSGDFNQSVWQGNAEDLDNLVLALPPGTTVTQAMPIGVDVVAYSNEGISQEESFTIAVEPVDENDINNRPLEGDNQDNIIQGGGGDDTLRGFGGHDQLFAGAGDDTLSGGLGDDQLAAGLGTNTLTGGLGVDHFIFDGEIGIDVTDNQITDFEVDQDVLDLTAIDELNFDSDSEIEIIDHIQLGGDGNHTTVTVDISGTGDFTTDNIVFTLQGIDHNTLNVVEMVNNGQIMVNDV